MKTHTGELVDRFVTVRGVPTLRAKKVNGRMVDVRVNTEDVAKAGLIWSRGTVHFYYRGGRPFFDATHGGV